MSEPAPLPPLRWVSVESLLLDPNSPRLLDAPGHIPVPEAQLGDGLVQARARRTLTRHRPRGRSGLAQSLRVHGWLPSEPARVRRYDATRWLVLDGNLRLAALRRDEAPEQPALFDAGTPSDARVPVMVVDDSPVDALVQGWLRQVQSVVRWSAIQQALVLRALVREHGRSPAAVCEALDLTPARLEEALQALSLLDQYRASPYGAQASDGDFDLFRALVRQPNVVRWLGLHPTTHTATETDNLQRLFSWLSEGEDGGAVIFGPDHLQLLDEIVTRPAWMQALDKTRDLRALLHHVSERSPRWDARRLVSMLDLPSGDRVERAMTAVGLARNLVAEARPLKQSLGAEARAEVEALLSELRGLVADIGVHPAVLEEGVSSLDVVSPNTPRHFSELVIDAYRGHVGTRFEGIARINLLAGVNNVGKTTALEAVHLLAMQHDETGLLGVVRQRGRVDARPDPRWIVSQLPVHAALHGVCAGEDTALRVSFARDASVSEQAFYLGSLSLDARHGARAQHSRSDFYQHRDRQTRREGAQVLCRSVLYSPFSTGDSALLELCNRRSIETGTKARILDFLREHVDDGIVTVEMVDTWRRFMVTHARIEGGIDLTQLGDGTQRVFLMCLLFAWAQHGIVLLDEFENAIHANLLPALARFIDALSRDFQVQVFLTSHSKEAIDALVRADLGDALSAYALRREDGQIRAELFPGARVARLLALADFDLRKV